MKTRADKVAHAVKSFVENPITNLVKGIALLGIGLSEASRTFSEDLSEWRLRVGHGMVIIGLFGILDALPTFIEGLEAGLRYLELRDKKTRSEPGSKAGPGPGENDQ